MMPAQAGASSVANAAAPDRLVFSMVMKERISTHGRVIIHRSIADYSFRVLHSLVVPVGSTGP